MKKETIKYIIQLIVAVLTAVYLYELALHLVRLKSVRNTTTRKVLQS